MANDDRQSILGLSSSNLPATQQGIKAGSVSNDSESTISISNEALDVDFEVLEDNIGEGVDASKNIEDIKKYLLDISVDLDALFGLTREGFDTVVKNQVPDIARVFAGNEDPYSSIRDKMGFGIEEPETEDEGPTGIDKTNFLLNDVLNKIDDSTKEDKQEKKKKDESDKKWYSTLINKLDWMGSTLTGASKWETIGFMGAMLWDILEKTGFNTAVKGFIDKLGEYWDNIKLVGTYIKQTWQDISDWYDTSKLKEVVDSIVDTVKGYFSHALEKIKDLFNPDLTLAEKVKSFFRAVLGKRLGNWLFGDEDPNSEGYKAANLLERVENDRIWRYAGQGYDTAISVEAEQNATRLGLSGEQLRFGASKESFFALREAMEEAGYQEDVLGGGWKDLDGNIISYGRVMQALGMQKYEEYTKDQLAQRMATLMEQTEGDWVPEFKEDNRTQHLLPAFTPDGRAIINRQVAQEKDESYATSIELSQGKKSVDLRTLNDPEFARQRDAETYSKDPILKGIVEGGKAAGMAVYDFLKGSAKPSESGMVGGGVSSYVTTNNISTVSGTNYIAVGAGEGR